MANSKPDPSLVNAQCSQPHSAHSLNQSAGLERTPEDVHYLIASELMGSSPLAVLSLGQTCTVLRQAALPFVYRNLVMSTGTGNSWKKRAYEALIELFRKDEQCKIAQHVRSITVKDEIPEEDLMTVVNKIAECGKLQTLR
jgi:hypothetical protein